MAVLAGMTVAAPPRLDQCQVIGTHNSYHVAPGPAMDALIRASVGAGADDLAYTHRPLKEQFALLGIRQVELDLYADPEGGRFAEPAGPKLEALSGGGAVPPHDPAGTRAVAVHTYFHGTILSAPVAAGDAVRVGVERGKHGSLPLDRDGKRVQSPEALKSHWKRLAERGRRLPDHALGAGWPVKFEGTYEDYTTFTRELKLSERLGAGAAVVKSRWLNAAIQQRVLRYNFRVKEEWPGKGF